VAYKRRQPAATLFVLLLACLFGAAASGCGLFVKRIPPGQIVNATEKDHFIRVGNLNLHYTEYPGTDEVIVLLHGFGSSTYSWEGVGPLLQRQGFHVYALDMKGFGWSDKPAGEDYGPLALTASVNDWMEALNLKEVVLVGNSLGGAVTVLTSLLHPDKVSSMVLVDAGGYPMKLPLIVKVARLPLAGYWVDLFLGRWIIKWNLREVFYHDDMVTESRIASYYDRLRSKRALRVQAAVAKAIDFRKFEGHMERARQLEVPTLLIWGEQDKWIPVEIGGRFNEDLRNSRLVIIPECGHVPQEEYPETTASLIAGFVRGKPSILRYDANSRESNP